MTTDQIITALDRLVTRGLLGTEFFIRRDGSATWYELRGLFSDTWYWRRFQVPDGDKGKPHYAQLGEAIVALPSDDPAFRLLSKASEEILAEIDRVMP